MTRPGKKVKESTTVLVQVMAQQDANLAGNVHGGNIMKLADTAAGVAAMRHSGGNVVTASVDRFDFHAPIYIGNIVTLKASLNYAGHTSMEVGVRVEAEDLFDGRIVHTNSCYFTMVALDADGKPTAIPPLVPEDEDDRRRIAAAEKRVAARKKQIRRAKQ
ncbi:MAG TPA: acyl-CoA thioesterase [Candidatus Deferrimicrobiaceae bacterium]